MENFQVKNFTEASFNLQRRQNALIEIGTVPCLCQLILAHWMDEDIIQQVLQICVGLLIGGNL